MEINYIQEFLTLVSVGNYLDASEELYTSSASLARHIRKLEDELGIRLFIPRGRSVVLSPQAETFLPFAQTLVQTQEQCLQVLETAAAGNAQLRIGILALENVAYDLSGMVDAFFQRHQETESAVYEGETRELCAMLQNRQLDLILSYLPSDLPPNLERFRVIPDEMALLVPAGLPLAARTKVSFSDLNGYTFLRRPRHTWLYDYGQDLLQEHHVSCENTAIPGNTYILLSMLAAGSSVCLMPKRFGHYLVSSRQKAQDIRAVDLDPAPDASVYLITVPEKDRPVAANRFLNFILRSGSSA